MSELKIGDNIFHKSNPTIAWTVEKIDDKQVFCSTLIKETYEQKEAVFTLSSVEKCAEPRIIIGKRNRNNHF